MTRMLPDYSFETAALAEGYSAVCGVDEVGRGPLAGPVTAAAVILDPDNIPEGLGDSKTLSKKRLAVLAPKIHECAIVCIAHAGVEEIDALNILRASHLAMERAVQGLARKAGFALIDGNKMPLKMGIPGQTIIKGDGRVLSIAAASIVAKFCRDQIMVGLAQQHPEFGWDRNAGYPTQEHREALQIYGATPHHRRSFAPVHKILYQDKI